MTVFVIYHNRLFTILLHEVLRLVAVKRVQCTRQIRLLPGSR